MKKTIKQKNKKKTKLLKCKDTYTTDNFKIIIAINE